ncbi:unnamed protein product [Rotaria sordida]|uniref:Cullin family profile domain-containing protein n=2 Tax=Rotaria sordida TaxID=392033 RepID=A0A819WA66_9BILA|nr:unnamed protein product [Rotaria sordida]
MYYSSYQRNTQLFLIDQEMNDENKKSHDTISRCDEREYRNIDDDIATTKLVYNELKRRGMVTTYEIVILLLCNKRSSWTVEQMQDETQINVNLFLQILYNLLKSKLIIRSEINNDELQKDLNENDIKMNYNIQIANNFKRLVYFFLIM